VPPFEALLEKIDFQPRRDRMLIAGDLVNRGHDSLGTLRIVYRHRDVMRTVLGNHDLHLLAVAAGSLKPGGKDTLTDILEAEDGPAMIDWLRQQPLLIDLPGFNAVMTHAGIPPMWTLAQARQLADEASRAIAGDDSRALFDNMYGNQPALWRDDLQGYDRLRAIINYFTRMRFIDGDGALDLKAKGTADDAPAGFMPWYDHPARKTADTLILFGHWAALDGHAPVDNVEALDTGCVWGNCLTALRLDDGERFSVGCQP
jgi:bis(5'-nucleosyl)-tetraphosphatase (symmetrical)